MNLIVGKLYKQRNGNIVRCVATDINSVYPVLLVGVKSKTTHDVNPETFFVTLSGFYMDEEETDDCDVICEHIVPRRWEVIVLKDGSISDIKGYSLKGKIIVEEILEPERI